MSNNVFITFLYIIQSFKRRYVYLKKQPDSTYAMEICKDEKKSDSKGQVFLDSAVEVLVSES